MAILSTKLPSLAERAPATYIVELTAALARGRNRVAAVLEKELLSWVLWMPLMVAIGISTFFHAVPVIVAMACVAGLLSPFLRKIHLIPVSILICAIALGHGAAAYRAASVSQPTIQEKTGPVVLRGMINRIEPREKDYRLYMSELQISGFDNHQTPQQIRLNTKDSRRHQLRIGDIIEVRAEIMEAPPPTYPGGFDTKRLFYFRRIAGIGYSVGKVRVLHRAEPGAEIAEADAGGPDMRRTTQYAVNPANPALPLALSWADRFNDRVNRLRQDLSLRIKAAMDSPYGAVANAMLIGETTEIRSDVADALRGAGTAHLVAISGLHVVAVSGIVFFFMRQLFARISWFALRFNSQKAAAAVAILSTIGYLFIAGSPVSAQRAVGTSSIFFMAMIIDREFDAMRAIALVGVAILLWTPENLFAPGLQMSFAASLSLIATFRYLSANPGWRRFEERWLPKKGLGVGVGVGSWVRKLLNYVFYLSLASLAASISTAPFIAYHFHQISLYSILANLICVPLTNSVVMPLGILGLVLVPLHLEFIPLFLMQWGIAVIIWSSQWVAEIPRAVITVTEASDAFLLIASVSFYAWAVVHHWQLRMVAVGVFCVNMMWFLVIKDDAIPDVIISGNGRLFAVNGHLICPDPEGLRQRQERIGEEGAKARSRVGRGAIGGRQPWEEKHKERGKLWFSSFQAERYMRKTWQQGLGMPRFGQKSLQSLRIRGCGADECKLCLTDGRWLQIRMESQAVVTIGDRVLVWKADLEKYGTHALFLPDKEGDGVAESESGGIAVARVGDYRTGPHPWQLNLG